MTTSASLDLRSDYLTMADVAPGPVELGFLGLGLVVVVGLVGGSIWLLVRLVRAKKNGQG